MINIFRKHTSHLKTNWFNYGLDTIVVIVGILIALLLNNWNEKRQDSKEEQLILSGLKDEFESNLDNVKKSIQLNNKVKSATNALIDSVRINKLTSVDSLIVTAVLFNSFDAQTGYISEIINSGKLSIINDQKLKARLTSLASALDNSNEDYELRMDLYTFQLIPFLTRHFPLANGDLYMDFSPWSDKFKNPERIKSPFEPDIENLNLLVFENILWQYKWMNDYVILNELEMEDFILETLGLIEDNLKPL